MVFGDGRKRSDLSVDFATVNSYPRIIGYKGSCPFQLPQRGTVDRINATDLEEWAKLVVARHELPRLLSRLIWASFPRDVSRLDMPGGELSELSGFDGIVECSTGDDLVPQGQSVWEVSTRRDISKKAEEDYTKRTANPGAVEQEQTTFVFATPRRWVSAETWATAKRTLNGWKGVRVLWSEHLEKWLLRVPWIAAEYSDEIAKRPIDGIQSLQMVWEEYHYVGSRLRMPPEFLIANRTTTSTAFQYWVRNGGTDGDRVLRISGQSEMEVLHFVAASVRSLPAEERDRLTTRILHVTNLGVASRLGNLRPEHILIGRAGELTPHIQKLAERWTCRAVIIHKSAERGAPEPGPGLSHLRLDPIASHLLVASLMQFAYPKEEAERICHNNNFDYEQIRRNVLLA